MAARHGTREVNQLEILIQSYRAKLRPEHQDLFDLLLQDLDQPSMVIKLGLSARTVATRSQLIYHKLGANGRLNLLSKIIKEARMRNDGLPIGCRTVA